MGKQHSLYLDDIEAKRLAEVASRECRRPADQLKWIVRQALMQQDSESQSHTQSVSSNREMVPA